MANQEQLEILKQGVEVWNKWRKENNETEIDLSGVDLHGKNLNEIDLSFGDLSNANLQGAKLVQADLYGISLIDAELSNANLSKSDLRKANLAQAKLCRANLRETDLDGTDLSIADLTKAKLNGANLNMVNFHGAELQDANLSDTYLWDVEFNRANLRGAIMSNAHTGQTNFGDINLSETYGLESVIHDLGSTIGVSTLRLSKGTIPDIFLQGCGLSDIEIESGRLHNPELTNEEVIKIQYRIYDLRATQAIQISPLFISYSHGDRLFVDQLDSALKTKGIRFWRDIHDMVAGRMETQIDRAIRQNPTVLVVLSKNSLKSDWVQHEVRKARELEKEMGRDILCPVALDDGWKSAPWPARVMEQIIEYNILDFSGWEDESTFNKMFSKLLNGLDLFYKKPEKS